MASEPARPADASISSAESDSSTNSTASGAKVSNLPRIAGVILAAGASRRMGRPKQLLEIDGESLARRTARIALEAGLDPVIVVLGTAAATVEASLAGLAVELVHNPRPDAGQGGSIAVGAAGCPDGADALLVFVCDQPGLDEELIRDLIARWRESGARIVRPRCGERPGHPVLFEGGLLPRLRGLWAGQAGRDVIRAVRRDDAGAVAKLEVEDPRRLVDVDREADWAGWLAGG
jgi:molybdenum cofactor cytidylyltransferase